MFNWIKKNLRPSQKIAAITNTVLSEARKRWTVRIKADIELSLEPRDDNKDGVPDIDQLAEAE